jgi:hypothetical protein
MDLLRFNEAHPPASGLASRQRHGYPISMPESHAAPLPISLHLARVRDCALLTALAIFGPYVVHVIPGWDDSPLGARLIPVFWAPLLGVFWRQYGFTLGLAFASPWINHLLFGMPSQRMAIVLSFELVVFTLLLFAMVRAWGRRAWMGPAGYLLTKPFSAALIAVWPLLPAPPLKFIATSVTTAWAGIIVLALLGWLAGRGPHQSAS